MSSGNRVRYQKYEYRENGLISVQDFVSQKTGARYRIILDLDKMTYHIRNERNKEFIFSSKPYKSLHVLKRYARKKLESYGIPLERESRWRTFGICKPGHTQAKQEELEKNSHQ